MGEIIVIEGLGLIDVGALYIDKDAFTLFIEFCHHQFCSLDSLRLVIGNKAKVDGV